MNDYFFYLSIGSLFLFIIAIPLARQKVKPNRWYGVRTSLILNHPKIWFQANRIYGLSMIISVFVFFLVSVLSGIWRNGDSNADLIIVLFIIEVSGPVVVTFLKLIVMKK
ncbi:SdpI family protein [Klebsiella aerogenes]|uniref:SdpI family protein n=1 Tax=Klebsiella aerogenes TaxID=548 RepID=UPI0032DB93D3